MKNQTKSIAENRKMNLIEKLGLEKCQHEWNETTSNGDVYRFFVCKHCDSTRNFIPLNEDITDYVSDIANHISPLTRVIDK